MVLSLTGGYRLSFPRDVQGQEIDLGNAVFLNPSIGFAVNNEVTLTGGVDLRFQGKDEIDNVRSGSRRTRVDLQFGAGYSWSDDLTLRFDARTNVNGDGGADLGSTATYNFGKVF